MANDKTEDTQLLPQPQPPPPRPPEEPERTQPFQPGATSTPASTPYHGGETIELSTLDPEQSGLWEDDIPQFEDFMNADEKKTRFKKGINLIKDKFKKVDFRKLGPIGYYYYYYSKKPGNENTIVQFGPKGGETEIFKKDGSGLLKSFTDRFKQEELKNWRSTRRRESRNKRRKKKAKRSRKRLKEAEKLALERERAANEVQNLRGRIEQTQARIDALEEENGSNLENQNEIDRLKRLKKKSSNRSWKQ